LVELKYKWYDYYAVYLKNFTEEERMKIRDFLQMKRADQWLYAYRLAVLTGNVSNLEYLCMVNSDLKDGGYMLDYAISSGHLDAAIISSSYSSPSFLHCSKWISPGT